MKTILSCLCLLFTLTGCRPTGAPLPPLVQSTPVAATTASPSLPTSAVAPVTPPSGEAVNVIFSINVHDFSRPQESAAIVGRILDLHEQVNLPVDIYLTAPVVAAWEQTTPALLERLRTSTVASVCYHVRPPYPYYTGYDWLGLGEMSGEEQRRVILDYETHQVDMQTGRVTANPGGYQHLADLLGYAPIIGSSLSGPGVGEAARAVYSQLGAKMTVTHNRVVNLGEKLGSFYLRPEHVDLKLYEHRGQDPSAVLAQATAAAKTATGARPPYFIGIKMHESDFFARGAAWQAIYNGDQRQPPWDLSLTTPAMPENTREEVWSLYAGTVAAVAASPGEYKAVGAPQLIEMLK